MTALEALPRAITFAAVLVGVLAAAAHDASATPNFPAAVKSKLNAVESPQCRICHLNGVTGRGTVNTAFGTSMRQRGLVLYDEGSLGRALTAMEQDRVDSDGDGTIDVDEIRQGNDPNPEQTFEDPTIPTYGCVGRIAPDGPLTRPLLTAGLVALAVLASRRRAKSAAATTVLLLGIGGASLAACALPETAALAPRSNLGPSARSGAPPRMAPVTTTAFEAELRAAGLDPRALPPFEALEPRQLRRVMGTFTQSLGFACTDCHDRADYRAPSRAKTMAARMWNEMTRPYTLDGGGAVYCDSCHHGQGVFLNRTSKDTVGAFMSDNFTGKLKKAKGEDVECETCHGEPFDGRFLSKW